MNKKEVLARLGIKEINSGVCTGQKWLKAGGHLTESNSPTDDTVIAKVQNGSLEDYEFVMKKAQSAFLEWRKIPAPQRGEVVRQIGNVLRERKEDLGYLVTLEMGKIYQEGLGEVQEMIDICDFAVGQSRLLNGFTMHSERPDHRMYDQYQPLGIVGLITSFNFPVAVWAWNSMLAAVAGDVVVWKPSSKTPLTAIAVQNIIQGVLKENNVPEGVFNMIVAKSSALGDNFAADKRIPLFSVTGSTAVGQRISSILGKRLAKGIMELGGNLKWCKFATSHKIDPDPNKHYYGTAWTDPNGDGNVGGKILYDFSGDMATVMGNKWVMLTMTFDASTSIKTIYFDGVKNMQVDLDLNSTEWNLADMEIASKAGGTGDPIKGIDPVLTFGYFCSRANTATGWTNYSNAKNTFKGAIDDFRIFNVALTESEVADLYKSEK